MVIIPRNTLCYFYIAIVVEEIPWNTTPPVPTTEIPMLKSMLPSYPIPNDSTSLPTLILDPDTP